MSACSGCAFPDGTRTSRSASAWWRWSRRCGSTTGTPRRMPRVGIDCPRWHRGSPAPSPSRHSRWTFCGLLCRAAARRAHGVADLRAGAPDDRREDRADCGSALLAFSPIFAAHDAGEHLKTVMWGKRDGTTDVPRTATAPVTRRLSQSCGKRLRTLAAGD